LLHRIRVLARPRYRANWIIGRYRADGFVWYTRGTNFSMTHEDWLRSLVSPFKGELFVDIGAHVGTWAIRATRTFRHVVAIEPHPVFNRILRTTVAMNVIQNISVVSAILSNESSETQVSSTNSTKDQKRDLRVPIRTLDSFKLKPDLIKIDTEGSEFRVLQGASQTLRAKPMIVIETHSREALVKSRQFVEAQGYSIREIRLENRFGQIQSWLLCN
jgi:FkbM family methyltransferase